MWKLILFSSILMSGNFSCSIKPQESAASVNWLKPEEVQAKLANNDKPILVDLYTDWCSWCKVMDKKTYSNPQLANYINEHFYPVKINAESKSKLDFKGKEYLFDSRYGANILAVELTRGNLAYPSTIIIPPGTNDPQPIAGYLKVNELEPILKFFGEKKYEQGTFENFNKTYKPVW